MLEESSSYSLADFVTTSSAKGEVEVEEVDSDGKFIRLINKSEKVSTISCLPSALHLLLDRVSSSAKERHD